jgi:hypothetical protein
MNLSRIRIGEKISQPRKSDILFQKALKVVATARPVDHVDMARIVDALEVFLQFGRSVAWKPGKWRLLPKQAQEI